MEPSGEANIEASSREELAFGHEEFPEGKTYPLNSKRLISGHLQALASCQEGRRRRRRAS